jgi:hypothetical protein
LNSIAPGFLQKHTTGASPIWTSIAAMWMTGTAV